MSNLKLNKLLLFSLLILYVYSYCSQHGGYTFHQKTNQYAKLPPNCDSVDHDGTEYYCSLCNIGFFLQDKQCHALTISKCIQQQFGIRDKQACGKCESGFYASQDNLSCESNPTPEQTSIYKSNCQKYEYEFDSDALLCIECESRYYVQDGNCIENPTVDTSPGDFIQGCQKYMATIEGVKCEQCNPQATQGVKPGEKICVDLATFDVNISKIRLNNAHEIAECNKGYMVNDSIQRCVPIPASEDDDGYDANCRTYLWGGLYPCWKCKNGYVKQGNICVEVPSEQNIPNCTEFHYESERDPQIKCQHCAEDYWIGELAMYSNQCAKCPDPPTPLPIPPPADQTTNSSILIFGILFIIINFILV